MSNKTIQELVRGYLDDSLTTEELAVMLEAYGGQEHIPVFESTIDQALASGAFAGNGATDRGEVIFNGIIQRIRRYQRPLTIRWLRPAAAAAAILLLLGAGMYLLYTKSAMQRVATPPQALAKDVAPGGNRAILTLSGGKQIILDSTANGRIAQQGNARIQKLAGGQLAYEPIHEKASELLYNTLTTPRGGQYQLTLPDGSKVWLNAASSITYPTAFVGDIREVTVTGEAYFEVFKNMSQPFRVKAAGQEIQVLGTHFNVNTYPDEPVSKTTLLEGSVRVSKPGRGSVTLQPGEQAQTGTGDRMGNSPLKVIRDADVEETIAWKNGKFLFDGKTDINAIMRQIARWYDIDVIYQGTASQHFFGSISRSVNVSQILRMLETTNGVHFAIEGKKVTVTP